MLELTLKKLNQVRKEGFRPGVVACIIHDKKLLMVYKKEYKLWMFPQGGINNKEEPATALERTVKEELGEEFSRNLEYSKVKFVDSDRMEFKPGKHKLDELQDDEGNDIEMLGKEYYFCALPASQQELNISKTVFDDYFWLNAQKAQFIAERIYQKGRKRITLSIIEKLQEEGIIQ